MRDTCRAAVQSSAEQARSVADALLARGGAPAFGDLTARVGELSPAERADAEAAAERIAAAVVEPFVTLASHPSAGIRATAIEFLGTRTEAVARQALVSALVDADAPVQRAALRALETRPHIETFDGVVALLAPEHAWPSRLAAARALSAYAKLDPRARETSAFQHGLERLVERALGDSNAFVRQAALSSLWQLSANAARPVLERIVRDDPEPRVVATARKLLDGGTSSSGVAPSP